MNANLTTLRTIITRAAVGASAVAIGALAMSAPAGAETFQHSCVTNPGAYATGAVKGVFSTQKQGWDLDQICRVYDANGKLLGTTHQPIYGYFRLARPVTPAPVLSNQ